MAEELKFAGIRENHDRKGSRVVISLCTTTGRFRDAGMTTHELATLVADASQILMRRVQSEQS